MPELGITFDESIGIIGAGAAGLITAHVLLGDGFTNVQLITRDATVGGVWAKERVYPGLYLNNVHDDFMFSAMAMEPPIRKGERISGTRMSEYMEKFAKKLIKDRVRFHTEVLDIRRGEGGWVISVEDLRTGTHEKLLFSRIVVCTGGCSTPKIPKALSLYAAEEARFRGFVLHSSDFNMHLSTILDLIKPGTRAHAGSVVIVGGGKSAQDISAYLANEGRQVTMVCEYTDAFIASAKSLPVVLQKSRLLTVLSPHIELRTRLERFLHTTWLGARVVKLSWKMITKRSFKAYDIPKNSPLRCTTPIYWSTRVNNEGPTKDNGFYAHVKSGNIKVVAPARVMGYGEDGWTLMLSNGDYLPADVVVLATGYKSSWSNIFSQETAEDIGISRHSAATQITDSWKYTSLKNPPPLSPFSHRDELVSTIYRGIVPAKCINCRDFAVNGATLSTNNGYTFEVSAHWISAYFLRENMRLPKTPEDAIARSERYAAWLKKRYPGISGNMNQSHCAAIPFWSWPQAVDELLEDMYLPSMRSGGNWVTWLFKAIDSKEIKSLGEERRAKRLAAKEQPQAVIIKSDCKVTPPPTPAPPPSSFIGVGRISSF